MSKVQGGELMLFLNGKSIAFATNHELNIDTDTSDFSCKDEGDCGWSNEEIDMLNWSVTSDNVFALNGEGNTYEDLFDLMLERTPIDAVFNKKSEDGCNVPTGGWTSSTEKPYKGKVIITDLSLTAQHGEYATFSATFMGYGELVDTSKIKYLWFEPTDYDCRFVFNKNSHLEVDDNIQYSLDSGETWNALQSGVASPTVQVGQKIMWKGEFGVKTYYYPYPQFDAIDGGIGTFTIDYDGFPSTYNMPHYKVGGDPNSLLTEKFYLINDMTPYKCAFKQLFKSTIVSNRTIPCTIVDTSEMIFRPMVLSESCYVEMFISAEQMTKTVDVLPSTNLAPSCYRSMYAGCRLLNKAPELPATQLSNSCYQSMFWSCASLTETPKLYASYVPNYAYNGMFGGCYNIRKVYAYFDNIEAETSVKDWLHNVAPCGIFVYATQNHWYNNTTFRNAILPNAYWVPTVNEHSVDKYNIVLKNNNNEEVDEIYFTSAPSKIIEDAPIKIYAYENSALINRGNVICLSTESNYWGTIEYDSILDDGSEPYTLYLTTPPSIIANNMNPLIEDGLYIILVDYNTEKPIYFKKFSVAYEPM